MNKMTLREIQQTELNILIEFDKVARAHNLRYSLNAGTLLGAVRHKGFIPWDDDIDVSMPRPDYETLIRLNKEQTLWSSHIELCCFEDGTLSTPFMKLFDRRTKIIEHNYKQDDVQSLWIDIFPLDGLPAEKSDIEKHYKKAMFWCRLNNASVVRTGYGSNWLAIIVKTIFMKPFARIIGRKNIAGKLRTLALTYPYESSPNCGIVTWAYDGPGQALSREEYEDLVELPFEGHPFFATASWDNNLSGIFHDYMQVPPESERLDHEMEAYLL